MILDAKAALPLLRLHGRTRFQEGRNALFFNWTCSGFTVRYCAETGDSRVSAFKLRGVNLMTEGYGALSHPSAKTHLRMGLELAERIRAMM